MSGVHVLDATGKQNVSGALVIVVTPGTPVFNLGAGTDTYSTGSNGWTPAVPDPGILSGVSGGGTADVHVKATLNGKDVYGEASWGVNWLGMWDGNLTIQLTETSDPFWQALVTTVGQQTQTAASGQSAGIFGSIEQDIKWILIAAVVIVVLYLVITVLVPALQKKA